MIEEMADEQLGDESLANRQYQQTNQDRDEEIVQVVYQSDQHGALVGVESTSLLAGANPTDETFQGLSTQSAVDASGNYEQHAANIEPPPPGPLVHGDPMEAGQPQQGAPSGVGGPLIGSYHEQLSRAASTLPPVAEEPFSGVQAIAEASGLVQTSTQVGEPNPSEGQSQARQSAFSNDCKENIEPQPASFAAQPQDDPSSGLNDTLHQYNDIEAAQPQQQQQQAPIYSTIKRTQPPRTQQQQQASYEPQQQQQQQQQQDQFPGELYDGAQNQLSEGGQQLEGNKSNLIDYLDEDYQQTKSTDEYGNVQQNVANDEADPNETASRVNEEIGHILTRRAGAVEKGSFRNNFRKKLGISVSTNENDLTAYRQKLLESSSQDQNTLGAEPFSETASVTTLANPDQSQHHNLGSLPSKFKRTHSVSFNVNSSRSNRHSVDIRNLPSYLTHKRASIVDVAKGAMSSLMSSLGGGGGGGWSGSGSAISGSQRRDSVQDDEPIFEEPIAPTLSLGQRVAMVRNIGAEFGTVGWIGQFPDVDDDWIVGVIFDNMIGDCDGAYNGVRYFYARENYAMFVPLSTLTKTDNYIGRPETGTMLSRMSVSLKPGQLISIQRSSIRLQHCFLNAPHQRVGHDVRAVSNRLHCQCHNCGPCAHLTKQQGRINALPHFGAHHLPHKTKNSLAHAAVEMLAHHHHHFHEEEEHEEKDYEFGDNAAHACNFVRYSCCQQSGTKGHEFSRDCEMVRPELLDNLIHAPKAPHRRHSRPRRAPRGRRLNASQPKPCQVTDKTRQAALEGPNSTTNTLDTTNQSTMDRTIMTSTIKSSEFDDRGEQVDEAAAPPPEGDEGVGQDEDGSGSDQSSYLSSSGDGSGSSRSGSPSRKQAPLAQPEAPYNYYTYDTSGFRPTGGVYNTINSQISFLDQQRFVYQRDSAAFMQSPKPSQPSDDYDTSNYSETPRRASGPSLGFKRILRCLGCLPPRPAGRGRGRRRRHRRKPSFRDKVLEYRRRQSTFVPSTLAKPHEDFASHGIVLPHSSGGGRQTGASSRHHDPSRGGEINSDYSSCSRSSCSSSRSNSPPNYPETAAYLNATIPMQTHDHHQQQPIAAHRAHELGRHVGTIEHEQSSSDYQLKSGQQQQLQSPRRRSQDDPSNSCQPQLNYGDYTFGDGYQCYEKHELSRDSALTDLCFTDTYKSNSSSDTLKHLVDQSINVQARAGGPREPP